MKTPNLRKMLGEFILMAALITGVAMVLVPVLHEPVFAEPLGTNSHITPMKYSAGYGGCIDPITGYPC